MTGRLLGARATYVMYATSIVVGLVIWEVVARQLPRIIIAPPSVVGVNLFQGFASGELALAFAGSLAHLCIGFAIAVCVGVPLGFLVGRNRTAFYLLDPTISGIYAVPPIAFVPFMIIWFGLFFEARVALVFLMSFIEIHTAGLYVSTATLLALMLTLMAVGVAANELLRLVGRRLAPWYEEKFAGGAGG